MWYVMGTMGQADAREELKAALYDLYEKHGKSVDGLRAELGDRDQAARQGFGLSGWRRGRPGPRQVEETNMTVNELVQELQRPDRPDLDVFIPCPHCCGQRGADFDLLDAEHVAQMERDGRQAGLLGDTRQQCLEDRRSDSRTRVRTAAAGRASELAAGLGLQYVRALTRTYLEQIYQATREGRHIARSRSSRLLRPNLVIEATDGQDTHYLMVETPFRATPEDIALVRMGVGLMTELTGCTCRAVIACVVRDSSAEADIASGQVHWHLIEPGDMETE